MSKKAFHQRQGLPLNAVLPALLFVFLLSAFLLGPYWHSFAKKQESVSYALYSYDRAVKGEKACFSLKVNTTNLSRQRSMPLTVSVQDRVLLAKNISIRGDSRQKFCFSTKELPKKSLVLIRIGEESLFYHLVKDTGLKQSKPKLTLGKPAVTVGKNGFAFVNFAVSDFPENRVEPIEIFLNNKLDHRVYPKQANENFSESVKLSSGRNKIRVQCEKASVETGFDYMPPFTLPLPAGLFLIAICFFVFQAFVFGKREFFGRSTLSLASIVLLFVVNGFVLDISGLLTTHSFVAVLLLELLALAFMFRENFSLGKTIPNRATIGLLEITILVLFLFLSLGIQLLVPSHQTAWSVYYERQASTVARNFGIPKLDPLSYLGRNFTFTPGYFFFEGALYWLTGALGTQMFALTIAFCNLLFLFSALFLGERLGFSQKSSLLFVLFLSMSTFVFTTFTLTPRHSLALSLLFISLALVAERKKEWLASVFLGVGMFVQLPLAVFYLFLCPFLAVKLDWKKFAKTFIGALCVFIPLYAFIPLASGLPFQAMPNTWGYLISLPVYALFMNPGLLFVFFLLFAFFEVENVLEKKFYLDSFKKKLLAGVILSLLLQVFVSSRFDLTSAVMVAAFLAYSLEKYKKELTALACFLFGLIVLFGLFLAIAEMPYYTFSQDLQSGLNALKENTSANERILADPYYGHWIAFKARRTTLADLMVEYANPEKLASAYRFLEKKDYSVLEKYDLGVVFSDNYLIHKSVLGVKRFNKPLEFREMDKVYTNRLLSIHRKVFKKQ